MGRGGGVGRESRRSFLSFLLLFKTNLSFNGSKNKKKSETNQKIPSPKIFFFLDTNCFVSCHILISILTQCVV